MSDTSSPEDRAQTVLEMLPATAPGSVVIGGWATWLRTRGARSHDVDLIVDWDQLQAIAGHARVERSTAQHAAATKWAGDWDGVHLDLYLPFQSRLGTKLELQVEKLAEHTERVDNQIVLSIPAQTAAKWAALVDRYGTPRGDKDREEVLQLLKSPAARDTPAILHYASRKPAQAVDSAIREGFEYLQERAPKAERRRLHQMARTWLTRTDTPPPTPARGSPTPGEAAHAAAPNPPGDRAHAQQRVTPPPDAPSAFEVSPSDGGIEM
jgi:hypothetical protein